MRQIQYQVSHAVYITLLETIHRHWGRDQEYAQVMLSQRLPTKAILLHDTSLSDYLKERHQPETTELAKFEFQGEMTWLFCWEAAQAMRRNPKGYSRAGCPTHWALPIDEPQELAGGMNIYWNEWSGVFMPVSMFFSAVVSGEP